MFDSYELVDLKQVPMQACSSYDKESFGGNLYMRARFASEFPQVSDRILLLGAVELMVACISGASGRVFDIQEGASVSLLWALT